MGRLQMMAAALRAARVSRDVSARVTDAAIGRIVALTFPAQRAFVCDDGHLVAALCTRRAGKTASVAARLLRKALRTPGAVALFLALTRTTAKALIWPWLKRINRDAGLGLPSKAFHESEDTVFLPNGSRIFVRGVDVSEEERDKLLGFPLVEVAIDESASMTIDLRQLVHTHIEPGTIDHGGSISLVGTPDPNGLRNFFYDVTEGHAPGWSVHRWTAAQNPHIAVQWAAMLAQIAAERPGFVDTPDYAAHYLGRWPERGAGLVYGAFDRARDLVDAAPVGLELHVLATDLGFNNATAFAVAGWSLTRRVLYLLRVYKRAGLTLTGDDAAHPSVEAELRALMAEFPSAFTVIDGAAKQSVEELRLRTSLPLEATAKVAKADFIRMMNGELSEGRVKLVRGACRDLVIEWTGADEDGKAVQIKRPDGAVETAKPLVWDRRRLEGRVPAKVEDASCENDASDAALYAWRFASHHQADESPPAPAPTEAERVEQSWEAARREIRGDDWDDDAAE